jgi:glycosyltransferase involved in cell wall biosynthesis
MIGCRSGLLPAIADSSRAETRYACSYSNNYILVCVGRLVYKKGFEYAIRAMPEILRKFPETHLVIAGTGDLERELKEIARKSGVADRVEFRGVVPHDQMAQFLAESDIFLLPSIVDDAGNVDGLPNTLLEAMTMGCAIVASQVAGVPEVIQDHSNGLLVPQRDSQALAEAVITLLEKPDLRQKLGGNARKAVEEQLSWQTIVGRYVAVFEYAVGKKAVVVKK